LGDRGHDPLLDGHGGQIGGGPETALDPKVGGEPMQQFPGACRAAGSQRRGFPGDVRRGSEGTPCRLKRWIVSRTVRSERPKAAMISGTRAPWEESRTVRARR